MRASQSFSSSVLQDSSSFGEALLKRSMAWRSQSGLRSSEELKGEKNTDKKIPVWLRSAVVQKQISIETRIRLSRQRGGKKGVPSPASELLSTFLLVPPPCILLGRPIHLPKALGGHF